MGRLAAKLAAAAAFILLYAGAMLSCQSTGPTGKAFERTEPKKTAEDLRQEEGPDEERAMVTRFGLEMVFRQCKVVFPRGAFGNENTFVTLSFPREVHEGFIPLSAYAVDPAGARLERPALLSIHYFDDDLPPGAKENDIALVELVKGQWFPLGDYEVDGFNNIVTAPIERLGTYALMLLPPAKPLVNDPPVARIAYEVLPLEPTEEELAAEAEAGEAALERETPPEPEGEAAPEAEAQPRAEAGGDAAEAPPEIEAQEQPADEVKVESLEAELAEQGGEAPAVDGEPVLLDDGRLVETEETLKERRESFIIETPKEPKKPEPTLGARVKYSAADSSDPDGEIARYIWDFDADGVADVVSSTPEVTRRYETYGNILAILRVEDNQQPVASGLAFAGVTLVRDMLAPKLPLSVRAVAFPAEIPAGGKAVFGAMVTGGEPPYDFAWSFSDGTTSDEQAVLLAPLHSGELRGNLTATDASGRSYSRAVTVKVSERLQAPEGKPKLRVRPGTVYLDLPGKVSFEAAVENAREPASLKVDPGFGEPFITSKPSFAVTYENAGYYVLTATVTDRLGRSAKTFVPIAVTPGETGYAGAQAREQRVSFGLDYAGDGATVSFAARNLPSGARVAWDFGDGTKSEKPNPTKKYAKAGEYTVVLTVDSGIVRQTAVRRVPIGLGALAAAIDLREPVQGMSPFKLRPHAIVTGGKFPLFYRWKLGDAYSEEEFPEFVLTEPGAHQLQLTVLDARSNRYDAEPVSVSVTRNPKKFSYPVAYIARGEAGVKVMLSEFDGSSQSAFGLGPEAPVGVQLSPEGTGIALLDGRGFEVYDLAGGRQTAQFMPSRGQVEELFLTQVPELLAFNLLTDAGLSGYIQSEASGLLPVSDRDESVLDFAPSGTAMLLASAGKCRMVSVDRYTGALSQSVELFGPAVAGKLTADASTAFFLGRDHEIHQVDVASGIRAQLTHDGQPKHNLQVSRDGLTVAYSLAGGEIFVIRAGDDARMPYNLSAITGFKSEQWELAPDGRLVLGYGKAGEPEGLYLLNTSLDLRYAQAEQVGPYFFTESTPQFSLSSRQELFEPLLNPSGPPLEAAAKEL